MKTHKERGEFIGMELIPALIFLGVLLHISILSGKHYGFHSLILFTIASLVVTLPVPGMIALGAHYNPLITLLIVIYSIVHFVILKGSPYQLKIGLLIWWGSVIVSGLVYTSSLVALIVYLVKGRGKKDEAKEKAEEKEDKSGDLQ
jgi:uncharacterized membrane protein